MDTESYSTYKRDIVGCGGIIKYENQFFRSEAYP